MIFHYASGTCSLGIRVILEEIGAPYQAVKVDFAKQEQYGPQFKEINRKSKVPVLRRDDGSVLTEFPAIAMWLALVHPEAKLVPSDPDRLAAVLEMMDYIVATMHMQGFSRMFRPTNFSPNPADTDAVKQRGREIFDAGLRLIDEKLEGREYLIGDYSIADAALFYVTRWASTAKIELPKNCARHYAQMLARPAVLRAVEADGVAV